MSYDYAKKNNVTGSRDDEAVGQVAQLKRGYSNASMLGEDESFSEIRNLLETSSGVSLGDVSVYYNSQKPAEIGALAYAKGNEVFLGPGQEQHLPHELTHVVQQKQGIVEPTGNIGGMPVNTSDSLEAAADRMSTAVPSGAVSGATPSGGVVQGIFISESMNNGRVPEEDVEAAIKMLEGAYQSHIDAMEKIKKDNDIDLKNAATGESANALKARMRGDKKLLQAYKNGKSSVRSRFKQKIKSEDKVYIEAYLQDELYKAQQMGYNAAQEGAGLTDNAYDHLSDAGKTVVDPGRKLKSEHTLNGFLRDIGRFSLNDTVFEGLDGVKDWSPAFDAGALTQVRMGGSASLTGNIGDGTATKTATNKQLTKMKKQFTKSTEISRKAALEIRSNKYKKVGFAFLYKLLQDLNKTVQEGMDSGGKLRAAHATAGLISSVGQNQLPEDLYWLLNRIASYIRIIGDMQDEKLRKSQAIRVAAFSYQMLISLHPFRDGNGRTCRLFSDTVLQAFGLPPHTPLTMNLGGTVGENGDNEFRPQIDFEKGSYAYLYAVRESSRILSGQKRSIPSDYEYLRKKDEPMPQNYATGEGYGNLTLDQRQRIWNDYKQGLQEEMNLDVSQREEREVKELRRKQKQMEEWKKNPELKRADLELQADQDAFRNKRIRDRRDAIKKYKEVNLENYKEDDAISLDNSSNNIINNNIINNKEDDKSSVGSNSNNIINNMEDDAISFGSNINPFINKSNGIKEDDEISLNNINNSNGIKEDDEISFNSNINNNIGNEEDDKISVGSINNNIINNKISDEDEEILINIDNNIKKDIKGEGKGAKNEKPELPFKAKEMEPRTQESYERVLRHRNAVVNGEKRGYYISLPAKLYYYGKEKFKKKQKKADAFFTSEKNRQDRQEKRHHNIIPGWGGAKFSDRGQQEVGKDILEDFRRVPTVWATPIPAQADTKKGNGTEEDFLPPKVTAYVEQPQSYSSASVTGNGTCGHAFVGIEYSQYSRITGRNERYEIRFGFYPGTTMVNTPGTLLMAKDTIGPGRLVDDRKHGYDISKSYTSNRQNIRNIAERAEKYSEEGGYGYYQRNCVTFTRDMLKAGNLPTEMVKNIFVEEPFQFNGLTNLAFKFLSGATSVFNSMLYDKIERYGKEDDRDYQGQGNKRMTAEEYRMYTQTNNRVREQQRGWIPAAVAENMRRYKDNSQLGSYRYVSKEYKKQMKKLGKTGDADDLMPRKVKELRYFASDPGEVNRAKLALQTAIYEIIPREQIEGLGKEFGDFKGWVKSLQNGDMVSLAMYNSVKGQLDLRIRNYKGAAKDAPKEETAVIWRLWPEGLGFDELYEINQKEMEDLSNYYAGVLKYDARIHKEVMNLLSAYQISQALIKEGYNAIVGTSNETGDLGDLREAVLKREITISSDKKEHDITPSEYEGLLQVYGSPQVVMEKLNRKEKLENKGKTEDHEYHKLAREYELAGDYSKAHRYLLNKGGFTENDFKYIFDLKKKEEIVSDGKGVKVSNYRMSSVYLAAYFEKIYSGLRQALRNEQTLPDIAALDGLKNKSIINMYQNWLGETLGNMTANKKAEVKTLFYAIKANQGGEKKLDEYDYLKEYMNLLRDSFLTYAFQGFSTVPVEKMEKRLSEENVSLTQATIWRKWLVA